MKKKQNKIIIKLKNYNWRGVSDGGKVVNVRWRTSAHKGSVLKTQCTEPPWSLGLNSMDKHGQHETNFILFLFHPTSTFLSTFTLTAAPFFSRYHLFLCLSVCRTYINKERRNLHDLPHSLNPPLIPHQPQRQHSLFQELAGVHNQYGAYSSLVESHQEWPVHNQFWCDDQSGSARLHALSPGRRGKIWPTARVGMNLFSAHRPSHSWSLPALPLYEE